MEIAYESLTDDFRLKSIELARLRKSLTVLFSKPDFSVTLPEFINVGFQCTDCKKISKIMYKTIDWINVASIHSFNCYVIGCEGKIRMVMN